MIALLIRFWWVPVILALSALIGVQQLRVDHAQTQLANLRTEYANAAQKAEQAARAKEQELQASANQIAEAKDEQIRIIGDQFDTALASLHNRPERPAPSKLPKTPSACKGATGAELSRPDAELLTRIAARADRLRSALDACYKAYDSLGK